MNREIILLLSVGLLAGLMFQCAADRDGASTGSVAFQRFRRTIGSGTSFVNCLEISSSRFCSYEYGLLETIEKAAVNGAVRGCPEGRVFRHRCNVCECKKDGALACSTDLCAEDFYDAGSGLPKMW